MQETGLRIIKVNWESGATDYQYDQIGIGAAVIDQEVSFGSVVLKDYRELGSSLK